MMHIRPVPPSSVATLTTRPAFARGQVWQYTDDRGRRRALTVEGTARDAFGRERVRGRTDTGTVIAIPEARLRDERDAVLVSEAPPNYPPPRSRR